MYQIIPADPRPLSGDQECAHQTKYIGTLAAPLATHEDTVNAFLEALRALEDYTVMVKSVEMDVFKINAGMYDITTQIHYKLIGPPDLPVLP
jgi:hypothetical protein